MGLNQTGAITVIGAGLAVVKAVSVDDTSLYDEISITVTTNIVSITNPPDYLVFSAIDAESAAVSAAAVSNNTPTEVSVSLVVLVADGPVTINIPISVWTGEVDYQTTASYQKTGALTLPGYVTNTDNHVPIWTIDVSYAQATGVDIYNSENQAFNPIAGVVDIFMEYGESVTVSGKVTPSNANQAVTLSVTGSSVSIDSATGVITAVGYGESTITATSVADSGLSETITVYVLDKIVSFTERTAITKKTDAELLASEYPSSITANLASGGTVILPVTYTAPAEFNIEIAGTYTFTASYTNWNAEDTSSAFYGISSAFTATLPVWTVLYEQAVYPYALTVSDSAVVTENGNQGVDITISPLIGEYTGIKWLVIQSYSDGAPVIVSALTIPDGISNYEMTYTISNTLINSSKYRIALLSAYDTEGSTGIVLAKSKEISQSEWID